MRRLTAQKVDGPPEPPPGTQPRARELESTPAPVGTPRAVRVNLSGELSEEERREIEELRRRDAEVHRHEQAHRAAAGQYALSGPHYIYQLGPDGQHYAVGGEVKIDMSPVPGDPEATARKARLLRQAALAPSSPSTTDRQAAAQAGQMEQAALHQLAADRTRTPEESTTQPDERAEGKGMPEVLPVVEGNDEAGGPDAAGSEVVGHRSQTAHVSSTSAVDNLVARLDGGATPQASPRSGVDVYV